MYNHGFQLPQSSISEAGLAAIRAKLLDETESFKLPAPSDVADVFWEIEASVPYTSYCTQCWNACCYGSPTYYCNTGC